MARSLLSIIAICFLILNCSHEKRETSNGVTISTKNTERQEFDMFDNSPIDGHTVVWREESNNRISCYVDSVGKARTDTSVIFPVRRQINDPDKAAHYVLNLKEEYMSRNNDALLSIGEKILETFDNDFVVRMAENEFGRITCRIVIDKDGNLLTPEFNIRKDLRERWIDNEQVIRMSEMVTSIKMPPLQKEFGNSAISMFLPIVQATAERVLNRVDFLQTEQKTQPSTKKKS